MATPVLRRTSTSDSPVRVLLLHGMGCTTAMWDGFAAHAGPELELWDVVLPWHGVDDPGWGHWEDQLSVVTGTLSKSVRFDAVVAHSFTAGLLLEAFAAGLVPAVPAVLANVFYRGDPEEFDWRTAAYYLNDFHLIFAEALRFGDAARLSPDQRSKLAHNLRDRMGAYGWMRFFASYLRSPFFDLSSISAPQLVLSGSADIAARPGDGRALADALPLGWFTELAGCGHFPMLERPEEFAGLVSEFIGTATTPRRPPPTIPVWS
jgi:pimeloyl-ACP methyl ester carboxylesterase